MREKQSRRDAIKTTAAASLGMASGAFAVPRGKRNPNFSGKDFIREENSKKGTRDWRLSNTKTVPGKINKILDNGRSKAIEGYCNANSLRAGEKLKIMVSANPASAFRLDIFRTGYYGGTGARLMKSLILLRPGHNLILPSVKTMFVSASGNQPWNWKSPRLGQWRIPWKMTAERSGIQSYVIFIVRDDRPCDFLFQCSDLTWSAYNRWPMDYSIYTEHENWTSIGVPSGTVSFDRPYGLFTHPVNKMKKSGGSGEYLPWEFPLAFGWRRKDTMCPIFPTSTPTPTRKGCLDPRGLFLWGTTSIGVWKCSIMSAKPGTKVLTLPSLEVIPFFA